MSGVFNSIKEAFPNFEEDQLEDYSTDTNGYKSEPNVNLDDSIKTSTLKSTKSFLLPDFFTSSNVSTPAISPSIEKIWHYTRENSKTDEAQSKKTGFKFASCEVEVNSFFMLHVMCLIILII